MSIAFAITYIFGTAGVSAFLALLGPKILGVDLAAECRALETAMGGNEPDPSVHSAYRAISVRAYRVTNPAFTDITVAEFESRFPNERLFIERLRQNDKIVESTLAPAHVLQPSRCRSFRMRPVVACQRSASPFVSLSPIRF